MITVRDSTLSANRATGSGGGLDDAYDVRNCAPDRDCTGGVTLGNSTLSGNTAARGGAIANTGHDTMSLSFVTIAGNSSGIAITGTSTVILTGTLLATNTPGANCRGRLREGQGYNLDSGTSCGFLRGTDLTHTRPRLGPLATMGGPTQTMALLPGSPALDHGGQRRTGCPATDQRGVSRPQGASCDIGAFERQP